jgi:hypothetical protein
MRHRHPIKPIKPNQLRQPIKLRSLPKSRNFSQPAIQL